MKTAKLWKVYAGLALGAFAVLALFAGCRKKELPSSTSAAAPREASEEPSGWDGTNYVPEPGAELKLWIADETLAQAVIDRWQQSYPDVPLTFEKVGETDTRQKLVLDGPAGLGADVFVQVHDGIYNAYQDGLLLPMGEYTSRIQSDYLEQAVQFAYIEGTQYGIPWTTENIAFFWNKDLYPGDPPQTWQEIVDFAKEYNDPKSNKWAIRWEVNNSYMNYFFLTAFGFELFGPQHNDPDTPNWDSPAVKEGLEYFSSLRPLFDVSADDASGEYTVVEFAKGTVPFTITGPWSIQSYKEAGVNFGVTKIPMLPGNRQPVVFSGNKMVHASSYTKYPNAARRLAMFLVEDGVLSDVFRITGQLPAKKDLSGIPEVGDDPYLSGISEQSGNSHPMPLIPEMAFAWEPLRYLFYYTWNRELDAEGAMAKANDDYWAQRQSAGN